MSTITKEWLQQKIADMEATRDDIPFGLGEDGTNTLAALRIALASLELERGMIRRFDLDMSDCDSCGQDCGADMVEDLDGEYVLWDEVLPHLYRYDEYTAPPAPVSVPDERAAFNACNNDTDCPLAGRDAKTAAWLAWCREEAEDCRSRLLELAGEIDRLRALVVRVPMPVVVPADIIQGINVKVAFAMGIERYGDAMLKLAKKEEGNG